MKKRMGILLMCVLMLSGCTNAENFAMLYEFTYSQGCVTSTSMYGDEDYNTHIFYDIQLETEGETPKEEELYTVSVYLQPTELEEYKTQYRAVGEEGNFIMECQRIDGTIQSYEFASEVKGDGGNKVVLRSELLKERESACFC